MTISSNRVSLRIIKLFNVLLILLPVMLGWFGFYAAEVHFSGQWAAVLVAVLYMSLYIAYGRIYNSFLVSLTAVSELIYSQCLAFAMSDGVLYVVLCLMAHRLVAPGALLLAFAAQLVLSVLWCVLADRWYFKKHHPKQTVVIYDRKKGVEELIKAYGLQKEFTVSQVVTARSCIDGGFRCLEKAEVAFLCGVHSHERNKILKWCVENDVVAYVLPRIGDTIMSGARPMHLFHLPFLRVGRYDPAPEYLLAKRLFDVVVSGIALVVLSPLMLVTAAAIKLQDGGPVFYRQKRLTQNGREFNVLKFRSMRQDAEKDGVARLSSGGADDRITPVGRFIRKVRIDELPQLFNILGGSMSIVGPRPERPEIAAQYHEELPEFSLRLQAKAGLTGYAQVYGKYNTTPYDKLQMDLMYIAHPSFLEDLKIIFATIKILFMAESTEGISKDASTALEKQEEEKVEV